MRINIPQVGFETKIVEGKVTVISIESPEHYASVLNDIWNQSNGIPGEVIWSENEKQLRFDSEISCIFNVLDLDLNNRKVITKLYKELSQNGNDQLPEETARMKKVIFEYLDRLLQTVPYGIDYDFELELSAVLKCFNVKLTPVDEDLLSKTIDYLRAQNDICRINNFILIQGKSYFSNTQLQQLYEFVRYHKLNLIILENIHTNIAEYEKNWIIDFDNCIIEVN